MAIEKCKGFPHPPHVQRSLQKAMSCHRTDLEMIRKINALQLQDNVILTFLAPFSFDQTPGGRPLRISPQTLDEKIWQLVTAEEYEDFTRGSAVFDFSKPTSLVWKIAATAQNLDSATASLSSRTKELFGRETTLNVLSWHLVGMSSNIVISSCTLEIDCSWQLFLERFPKYRNSLSTDLRDVLITTLENLRPRGTQLAFPYFHILMSGQLTESVDRPVLDSSFRDILYPENNAPVTSMSPHPGEFIFLGYAFSLILCPGSPLQRSVQILPLLEYTSGLYRELAMASNSAQSKIVNQEFKRNKDIHSVKNQIRIMYYEFISPTFSYTHEMLVLRDGLLSTWRVDQLLRRADFLVTQLDTQIKQWQVYREQKTAKRVNIFLFIITLSTLISVIYDATMMARTFDFLKTAAVEAWENLLVR